MKISELLSEDKENIIPIEWMINLSLTLKTKSKNINESYKIKYPKELKNNYEIADYIISVSTDIPYDKEQQYLLANQYKGCAAKLITVPIYSLYHADTNDTQTLNSQKIIKKYANLSPETMPPLLVKNNEIMDGYHRFFAAKLTGVKNVPIYNIFKKNKISGL